ncbi:MAG TPA: hypothetical protein VGW38_07535 [Chloroflexota bacterium]|nr:hypothetical protein [Chloroflexota bacterium]
MAFTGKVTVQIAESGRTISGVMSREADGKYAASVSVPASTTNKQVEANFTFADAEIVFLKSDKDVTLYTNAPSTGVPADTIVLKAGVPKFYVKDGGMTNLFTANVTAIYLTNAGNSAALVDIVVLNDVTP